MLARMHPMLSAGTAAWGGRVAVPRKMAMGERRLLRVRSQVRKILEVGHPGDILDQGPGMHWRIAGAKIRTKDLGKQRGREGSREPVVVEQGGSLQSLRDQHS